MHLITDREIKQRGCEYCIDKGERSRICPYDNCPYTVLDGYKNYAEYCRAGEKAWERLIRQRSDRVAKVTKHMKRAVRCIDTGEVYKSIDIASVRCGVGRGGIWSVCNGRQKKAGNLRWEYVGGKRERKVRCIETGELYDNALQAEEKTGVYGVAIGKACRGNQKQAGGFHWEYVDL